MQIFVYPPAWRIYKIVYPHATEYAVLVLMQKLLRRVTNLQLYIYIIAYIIVWTIGPPGLYLSLKIIIIIINPCVRIARGGAGASENMLFCLWVV